VVVFSCWSTWVRDNSPSTRRRRSTRQYRRLKTWVSILTFGRERPVHSITRTHHQEEDDSIYSACAEIQLEGRVQGQKRGCSGMAFVSMQCVDYEYQAFLLVQLGQSCKLRNIKTHQQLHKHCLQNRGDDGCLPCALLAPNTHMPTTEA
jgi:hypothetical protein